MATQTGAVLIISSTSASPVVSLTTADWWGVGFTTSIHRTPLGLLTKSCTKPKKKFRSTWTARLPFQSMYCSNQKIKIFKTNQHCFSLTTGVPWSLDRFNSNSNFHWPVSVLFLSQISMSKARLFIRSWKAARAATIWSTTISFTARTSVAKASCEIFIIGSALIIARVAVVGALRPSATSCT